jgi:hypothetical protein
MAHCNDDGVGMTEEKWLASTDPEELLEFLQDWTSSRKFRLFAVASFRHDWDFWPDRRERFAIVTAERMADGMLSREELVAARTGLIERLDELDQLGDLESMPHIPEWFLRPDFGVWYADNCVGQIKAKAEFDADSLEGSGAEVASDLADLLRDIFGNPFRHVTLDPRWRTSDVVGLAHAIYDDKAFERMPILADALMDAGCEDEQVIGHCRGDGPHVRGCWVVDLVLERE